VVAVDAPSATRSPPASSPRARRGWLIAAAVVLVVGIVLRLLLVPPAAGGLPAVVMLLVLASGAWILGWILGSPRVALTAVAGVVLLVVMAGLPARPGPNYDERSAFYRTDQVIEASVSATGDLRAPVLELLVEPVAAGAEPRFGLAGEVGPTTLEWSCPFQRGLQRVALPLPRQAIPSPGPLSVRLHLTGTPSAQSDYLLVYSSARRYVVSVVDVSSLEPSVTRCSVR
jgi:hypothetical protein